MFVFTFYVFTSLFLLNNFGYAFIIPNNSSTSPTADAQQRASVECFKDYKLNQFTIGNIELAKSLDDAITYFETHLDEPYRVKKLIPKSDIKCVLFCIQKRSGTVDENANIVEELFHLHPLYSTIVKNERKAKFDECYQRIHNASSNLCNKYLSIELCALNPAKVIDSVNTENKLVELIDYWIQIYESTIFMLSTVNQIQSL